MNEATQWVIPHKKNGFHPKDRTFKWDVVYAQAVKEISAEVSSECGRKIGFATLLMNLAGKRTPYFTEVSKRLDQRVKQLSKEKRHAHQNQPSPRSPGISGN